MSKTHRFSISTVTPVSIGNGGAMSPLVDYVLDNNYLYYIDKKKLEKLFTEHPAAFEDYLTHINSNAFIERNDFLKNLLKQYFELEAKDIAKMSIPAIGIKSVEELKTIVKEVGRPYIPGSTLKGAIKATIMYGWLKNNPKGQSLIQTFISYLSLNKYELRELCFQKYVDIHTDFKKKKAEDQLKKLKKETEYLDFIFNAEIENVLYGDLKARKRMDTSLIQISDSQPISVDNLCGIGIFRIRLYPKILPVKPVRNDVTSQPKSDSPWGVLSSLNLVEQEEDTITLIQTKKEAEVPLIREAIKSEAIAITTFDLNIIQENRMSIFNTDLKFLNGSVQELLTKINQFAQDYTAFEIKTLNGLLPEYRNKISSYDNFLSDILSRNINNADTSKEAYLCLGMGKSYFLNSIGMLIAEHDIQAFKKMRDLYKLGESEDVDFPASRTLCRYGQLPLGWVKISIV